MNHLRASSPLWPRWPAPCWPWPPPPPPSRTVPPPDGSGIAPPPPPVRFIAEGGMPGWQITLIALAAALVAAVLAVLLDRARAARKIHLATA